MEDSRLSSTWLRLGSHHTLSLRGGSSRLPSRPAAAAVTSMNWAVRSATEVKLIAAMVMKLATAWPAVRSEKEVGGGFERCCEWWSSSLLQLGGGRG